jgi:hypothetical protein
MTLGDPAWQLDGSTAVPAFSAAMRATAMRAAPATMRAAPATVRAAPAVRSPHREMWAATAMRTAAMKGHGAGAECRPAMG